MQVLINHVLHKITSWLKQKMLNSPTIFINEDINTFLIHGIHKRIMRFQRLTRNLFLTLHGHNVHCQQWQLSKFLMRYSQSFDVCTLGHTTHMHTVIKFIPGSVKHVCCNGQQCMRYPITKFSEGHGQCWYVNAVFNKPPEKETAWC